MIDAFRGGRFPEGYCWLRLGRHCVRLCVCARAMQSIFRQDATLPSSRLHRHGSKPGYREESESGVAWEGGVSKLHRNLHRNVLTPQMTSQFVQPEMTPI